ncbi:MAG: hypothetical protein HKP53_02340 [Eudoraea sp.]|nr:hypothetical protein [Eudoraea sp.]
MRRRNRHWLWNAVIVLTVLICMAAFILHFKTWTRQEKDHVYLISGFYSTEINFSDIENVSMVPRIPEMERVSGFSVWAVEKGIFRDTLGGVEGIRVYVDDLNQPKIKLERKEDSEIYFNFKDSLKTKEYFNLLTGKIKENLQE